MRCFAIGCALAALALVASGCGKNGPAGPTGAKPAVAPTNTSQKESAAPKADPLPGLAELSPADRAAAEKQGVCPVSGEKLGSMGAPVKIVVKGQTVFLCCKECKAPVEKDPDKYLAKLKAPR